MKGLIDVHHHVPSAEIAEAAQRLGIPMSGDWSPEAAIEAMDANGIAAAVLTPTIFIADVIFFVDLTLEILFLKSLRLGIFISYEIISYFIYKIVQFPF